ncbi:hypothetical protein CRM22_002812 [Opisthorchis felineus]|uniref:Uncharacterized protein n=1 Tax=Opisthorchis felineus TaxID=147828 RepID=A0A4S2M4A0_OPIFE|nr:hypothetical protein CRM22_002812 [Opisthorchis felineus]
MHIIGKIVILCCLSMGGNTYIPPYYPNVCNCEESSQCIPGCLCYSCNPGFSVCSCLDSSRCSCTWKNPGISLNQC